MYIQRIVVDINYFLDYKINNILIKNKDQVQNQISVKLLHFPAIQQNSTRIIQNQRSSLLNL